MKQTLCSSCCAAAKENFTMSRKPTHKEKTLRAFGAWHDLLDTTEWMRVRLRDQLESFDLTIEGFRLLEMICREGPVSVVAAAERRRCTRTNIEVIVRRLEHRGWVQAEVLALPPAEIKETRLPKSLRGKKRKGRKVALIRLTPLGDEFIRDVFPKHAKVVKSLMRALDAREQQSLSRICRKLREGDPIKFLREMVFEDEDEDILS
jgi:DNA-binding MarR family transcriptional regulator